MKHIDLIKPHEIQEFEKFLVEGSYTELPLVVIDWLVKLGRSIKIL